MPAPASRTCRSAIASGSRSSRRPSIRAVRGVDLQVRSGEIVAVAGVDGNGQMELARATAGLLPVVRGEVYIDGQRLSPPSVRMAIDLGLAYVPADRGGLGLVFGLSIEE